MQARQVELRCKSCGCTAQELVRTGEPLTGELWNVLKGIGAILRRGGCIVECFCHVESRHRNESNFSVTYGSSMTGRLTAQEANTKLRRYVVMQGGPANNIVVQTGNETNIIRVLDADAGQFVSYVSTGKVEEVKGTLCEVWKIIDEGVSNG